VSFYRCWEAASLFLVCPVVGLLLPDVACLGCLAGLLDRFLLVVQPVCWSAGGNLLVRINERMFP